MVGLFQVPQPSLGLMGRQRDTRNRMPPGIASTNLRGLLPPPADAIDEAMMARRAEQEALVAAQQPRQRDRVSGWRILDRVLGGQTVSEGLDAERARLQAIADTPRAQAIAMENERIARAMGPQALLALRLNGEQLGSQVAEGYGTDVVAAGSGLFRGGQRVGEQATFAESGDQTLRRDSMGVRPVYTRTEPSIAERTSDVVARTGQQNAETNRYLAERPVLAANTRQLNPDGSVRAEGYIAPDIQNVVPGAEALVFNQGQLQGRVVSTQPRPISDADQSAIARADLAVTQSDQALGRAARLVEQIAGGQLRLGMVERGGADLEVALGRASPNALAIKDLEQWAKQARDAILASNTGVQTDQDAIRALDNVLANMNDERLVSQYLNQFITATSATKAALERDIARRSGAQSAQTASPDRRLSPQEAAALPSGTRFVGTDGIERVRQ